MKTESVKGTFLVAFVLCAVCSVLVSGATVLLRSEQQKNQKLDIQRNLLIAAALINDANAPEDVVAEKYKLVESTLIELQSGEKALNKSPDTFNALKDAKTDSDGLVIPSDKDLANIKRRAKHGLVYLIKTSSGEVDQLVLPIYGKGLWSTLYGFLALSPDTMTVKGLGFYHHGETPGLGGEVDNPRWKSIWIGKKALDPNNSFKPWIRVIKGNVTQSTQGAEYKIDGLSGATLTSNGVQGLVNYWMGDHGYGPFLAKWRAQANRVGGVQ